VKPNKQQQADDPVAGEWPLDDEVIGLRRFGTDESYPLSLGSQVQTIGASAGCDVVIRDRARSVAGEHAKLIRHHAQWTIRAVEDVGADGLRRNEVPLREFPLVAGTEIGLGEVTLIVESERERALRRTLRRLIGFDAASGPHIDRALRVVLTAASGRGVFTLCGHDDLVAIAHQLHRHTLPGRPFVVCDRRRGEGSANPLLPPNIHDATEALALAAGGTLCMHYERPPRRMQDMLEQRRAATTRVQLVVCAAALRPPVALAADPFVLRPLARRANERDRLIDELTAEAAAAFGAQATLSEADRRLIVRFDGATLSAIEKATLRIVALRHWNSTSRAARELNMSHATLTEWALRRRLIPKRSPGRPRLPNGRAARRDAARREAARREAARRARSRR
jgi:hypothetical protein